MRLKMAFAATFALIVSVQLSFLPVQAPRHEPNLYPVAAWAVIVSTVPPRNRAVQSPGHATPGPVTMPVPFIVTVSRNGFRVNPAPTDRAVDVSTEHAFVPEHAPLQPSKELSGSAEA